MTRRVCLIVGNYTFSLINFRGDLITELQRCGYDVVGCGPDRVEETERELQSRGVEFVQVPMRRVGSNPFVDLHTLYFLWRLCRKIHPDLVISYTIKPVIYTSLAARWAGCRRIYSLLTGLGTPFLTRGFAHRGMRFLIKVLYRTALRYNNKVFFQNPDDMKFFLDAGLVKSTQAVRTNGSGVNLEYFSYSPLSIGRPRFLMIARLLTDKGVCEFAEAAKIVRERYGDIKFDLVGPIENHPKGVTIEEIRSWEGKGLLAYWGKLADVRPRIQECSVYVLPSYREGTPRSVLEAMAMGRAIITTDAPGCRETVQEGRNGYLVPVRDSSALAEAMGRFIEAPELVRKLGDESRKLACELFDVRVVNQTLLEGMELLASPAARGTTP